MKVFTRFLSSRLFLLAVVLTVLLVAAFASTAVALAGDQTGAKNVILFINDGTGYNTWTAGDYWMYGETGRQAFEKFDISLGVSTFPLNGSYSSATAWGSFGGVLGDSSNLGITESDMAATAMATGLKTAGGVGWAPDAGTTTPAKSQKSILEYAHELGKATGVVTTKFFTDATPAGFGSHVNNRDYYGTIADQIIDISTLDVLMGGGNPYFDASGNAYTPPASWTGGNAGNNWNGYYGLKKPAQYLGLREWTALAGGYAPDADHDGVLDTGKTPWTFVQTRADFKKLANGATPARVFGLAQSGGKSLQEKRAGDAFADPYVVPLVSSVPTAAEMTAAALNVLDNNPNGFVAMIEAGGAVDDACHDGYPGRVIEEYNESSKAMQVIVDWIGKHGGWEENLLIVTSDHDTGYLWGAGSGAPNTWNPIVNNGKRNMSGFGFFSTYDAGKGINWHTNALVPLWARGAGSAGLLSIAETEATTDSVRGPYIDNTDIFKVMYDAIQ